LVKKLQVYSEDPSISKRAVHSLISSLVLEFNLSISFLSISFISSPKLRSINQKYLKHDFNTDIITFNYSKKADKTDGEILISFEEARLNAKKYKTKYSKEISRLIVHGVLHLLNYDDNNKKNKVIMKQMENKLINRYNFTLLAGKQ
jgi:probable rRNA maturation factor